MFENLPGDNLRVLREEVILLKVIIVLPSSPEEGDSHTGRLRLLLLDSGEPNKSKLTSGMGDSAAKLPDRELSSGAIFSLYSGLCREGIDPRVDARLCRGFFLSRLKLSSPLKF